VSTAPTNNNPILLRTEGLVKIYGGRSVVNGVDINVKHGEVVGLLGPNGAGKTTSFYMTVGLVKPDGGKVFFDGHEVTHMPMHKRARLGIGYLSQEPSVFRKLTVEENILAILETLPLTEKERKRRLNYLLDELDIGHLRRNKAYTLSGGERRRLEITRALVTNPKLMLLDEPFSGVDPIAVYEVQQIIVELKKKGLGILVTDHNVRETLSIVDRAYLICEGKVEREGTSEFLINDPKSRELYLGPRFSM
jgi:lipopolysaccharide export system ATP-binding protein